ncbi:MAG: asparagine synthase-related protein, partial [Gemmatimonas sp.]
GGRRESKLAADDRYTVIADATLYYRDALARQLRHAGCEAPDASAPAARWILAALQAWGEMGMHRLEGDFAWIAWDATESRLLAARDHAGTRPLFFASVGHGLAVSSLARTLRRVAGVPRELNLLTIAEDAADVGTVHASETPFAGIARLPAGCALRWSTTRAVNVSRWWEVPIFDRRTATPFDEASDELLELIGAAVRTRFDVEGTAVLLSGGYDSTSVYGAGQMMLQREGLTPLLKAVSVSHPEGDPGREDELILATTQFWHREPTWVAIDEIPAIDDPQVRAIQRDEPFVHTYELWNRALAVACRRDSARVVFNGLGGDFWFSLSPVFFADHLRQLRWRTLRREWRALFGRMTAYDLFKNAIRPNMPPWIVSVGRRVTGMTLGDLAHRSIPPWIRPEFAKHSGMIERRYARIPRRRTESFAGAEQAWFLQSPFIERVSAQIDGFYAEAGLEVRSPLMDARVIRYAAGRPREESLASSGENKRLLRRALRGLLPDSVTGPRTSRTGLPVSYFHRTVCAHLQQARADFDRGMCLADLGVVDSPRLLSAIDRYLGGAKTDPSDVVAMSYAAHAEWWLRSDP